MASALAVFRVSKVVEEGVEVTPEVRYTDSLIRYIRRPLLGRISPIDARVAVTRKISSAASGRGPLAQKR